MVSRNPLDQCVYFRALTKRLPTTDLPIKRFPSLRSFYTLFLITSPEPKNIQEINPENPENPGNPGNPGEVKLQVT